MNRNALASESPEAVSRYSFIRTSPETLRVEGVGRNPVEVRHTGTGFEVSYPNPFPLFPGDHRSHPAPFGLFEYHKLSRAVAEGLLASWRGDVERRRKNFEARRRQMELDGRRGGLPPCSPDHVPKAVRAWAVKNVAEAIGKRLHAWWVERLGETPPVVREVQRTAFAATMGAPPILRREKFYREAHPSVLSDLTRYRAAAVALGLLQGGRHSELWLVQKAAAAQRVQGSPEYDALLEVARQYGVAISLNGSVGPEDPRSRLPAHEAMKNWRGLFSLTGESYRSLNRTLDHLPGGVCPANLMYLGMVYLPRPLLHRLELSLVCMYAKWLFRTERPPRNESAILHATPNRIRRAFDLVSAHTHGNLSHRKTEDMVSLVGFLMDYPAEHKGNIVGLAEKSIAWHRDQVQVEVQKTVAKLGGTRETARPR